MVDIIYNENPLCSNAVLDEADRRLLFETTRANEYEEQARYVRDLIHKYKGETINQAIIDASDFFALGSLYDEEGEAFETVKQQFDWHVDQLTKNYGHCGDCTKHASTCSKCLAEQIVGVTTVPPGVSYHDLYTAYNHFTFDNKNQIVDRKQRSGLEALKFLADSIDTPYEQAIKTAKWKYSKELYDYWNKSYERTFKWLRSYLTANNFYTVDQIEKYLNDRALLTTN